ncbi:hypothetical protein ZHAS_00006641 [Anopheles sinensis]|uniref:Uncharacterized protein n=1 Tax=Anopheles sinensis TaxID=74873 RepID=A0A084VMU4_ANOSI|nr:hypothetical protein ZHAS_00006641 [Anopheles sinensis]
MKEPQVVAVGWSIVRPKLTAGQTDCPNIFISLSLSTPPTDTARPPGHRMYNRYDVVRVFDLRFPGWKASGASEGGKRSPKGSLVYWDTLDRSEIGGIWWFSSHHRPPSGCSEEEVQLWCIVREANEVPLNISLTPSRVEVHNALYVEHNVHQYYFFQLESNE